MRVERELMRGAGPVAVLKLLEFLVPPPFQGAGHQPVLRIDCLILPFRPAGLVAGPFQLELPLAIALGGILLKVREHLQGQL